MIITYYDGGKLECSRVEIYGENLIADDVYIVPLIEINSIEE